MERHRSADEPNTVVFSAIDDRFDQNLLRQLQDATTDNRILCVSALSRYSRNSAKLHRILEYLLAHGATILTTDYFIRPTDVWTRRGDLVKPASNDPAAGLAQMHGLTSTHRKLAAQLRD